MRILAGGIGKLRDRWTAWRTPLPAALSQAQLAALMQVRWLGRPRYRLTQPADRAKARRTWEAASRWYLVHHLVRHQGHASTATRSTASTRRSSFPPLRIRRLA